MEPTFARHPLANVCGASHETNAPDFALDQESNRLQINERDFSQIEDRASNQLLVDESTEFSQLLRIDSAAHGQRGCPGVNGTNNPEHRD